MFTKRIFMPLLLLGIIHLLGQPLYSQTPNNCLDFDGVGDEVDCGSMTQLNGTSAFTYEAWIKIDSWTNFTRIMGKEDSSTSRALIMLGGVQGRIIALVGDGSNSQGWTASTSAVALNTWTHIAVVYDGTLTGNGNRLKMYIDGTLVSLVYANSIPATTANFTNNFFICETASSTTTNFDGQVDEVRIWSAALTATTIDNWNNNPVTSSHPNYSALEAYYMMDDPLTPLSLADSVGTSNGIIDDATYIQNSNLNFCYPPTITAVESAPSCYSSADGSLTLTMNGLFSPYTFNWANGSLVDSITNVTGGNYDVTITDSWGCTYDTSFSLNSPDSFVVASSINNIDCYGNTNGSLGITVTGGTGSYNYLWSNSQTTASINTLSAGQYTVTITDGANCTQTNSFSVTEPDSISISNSITAIDCYGNASGDINITASGGNGSYSYLWNNTQTTSSISGLVAGQYSITVTDNLGCSNNTTVTLVDPDSITVVSLITDLGCYDDSSGVINIGSSGGTGMLSFLWSNTETSSSVSNLSAGQYTLTVTDNLGCTSTYAFNVNQPDSIGITYTVADVVCINDTDGSIDVSVTGGTMPYNLDWSDNSIPSGTTLASNLTNGNYVITISDQNGCTKIDSTQVNYSFDLPIVDLGPDTVSSNLSIDLTPGNQYSAYLWSTTETTNTISVTSSGSYSVTCTDVNGCMNSDTISVLLTTGIYSSEKAVEISVYPIPANDQITVEWKDWNSNEIEINIIDVTGRILLQQSVNGSSIHQTSIALESLSPGSYYLTVSGEQKSTMVPLVVQ